MSAVQRAPWMGHAEQRALAAIEQLLLLLFRR